MRARPYIESMSRRYVVDVVELSVGMNFECFLKKLYEKPREHTLFSAQNMDFLEF